MIMNSLVLNRRRFLIWFEVLTILVEKHKDDVMFVYYLSKNLANMKDEYQCLRTLQDSTNTSTIVQEFQDKKEIVVEELRSEGVTENFESEPKYKELVLEYAVPVKQYDVDCNTIGSYLHEKTNFTYYPIPYRYIPKEITPIHFEFIFNMIEEDLGVLVKKYGK